MLAMSLLLAVFELRDHRGLDGDLKAEGDRRRTHSGRSAAEDGGAETFQPREERAKPRGRKSQRRQCGSGDRGVAGLRPDQANERPGARGCAEQHFRKETWQLSIGLFKAPRVSGEERENLARRKAAGVVETDRTPRLGGSPLDLRVP
jgi:hypothetical protein